MDDFDNHQARSAAKDVWQAFKVGHEQTAWTEEEAFIACVSCALLRPLQRVGELAVDLKAAQESNCLLIDQIDAYQQQHSEDVQNLTEKSAEIDRLRNQIAQFQKRIMEKTAQVWAETGLRVEAEKRLADIMEILVPFDPPENYAAVVDKIAILANPERYACDPVHEPSPTCCEYHKEGGDTYAECCNFESSELNGGANDVD